MPGVNKIVEPANVDQTSQRSDFDILNFYRNACRTYWTLRGCLLRN